MLIMYWETPPYNRLMKHDINSKTAEISDVRCSGRYKIGAIYSGSFGKDMLGAHLSRTPSFLWISKMFDTSSNKNPLCKVHKKESNGHKD